MSPPSRPHSIPSGTSRADSSRTPYSPSRVPTHEPDEGPSPGAPASSTRCKPKGAWCRELGMERRIRRGHGLRLACLFAVVLFVTSGLTAGSAFWGFPSTGAGSSVYSAAGVDAICASNHIHVSVADGISGAGHSSLVILVHNNGSHTCRLLGYPEVQLLDAGGTVAAVASETASGFAGGTPLSTPRPGIELGAGK